MNKPRKTFLRKFIFIIWNNFFINKFKLWFYLFVKYLVQMLKVWSKPTRILYQMRKNVRKKLFYMFCLEKRAYFLFWYKYFRWIFIFSRRSRRSFIFSFRLWLKSLFPYFRLIDLISIDYFSLYITNFKLVWKFIKNLLFNLKLVIPNQILSYCLWIYNLLLFIFSIFVLWFLFKHHCLFIVISGLLGYFLCFWKLPSFLSFLASGDYWKYIKYAPFLFTCFNLSLSLAFVEIIDTVAVLLGEEVVNISNLEDLNINKQKQESISIVKDQTDLVEVELTVIDHQSDRDRSRNDLLSELLWRARFEVKSAISKEDIADFSVDMVKPNWNYPDFSRVLGNHPDLEMIEVEGSQNDLLVSIFTGWEDFLMSKKKDVTQLTQEQQIFLHKFDLNRRLVHPDLEAANFSRAEWIRVCRILEKLVIYCKDEVLYNRYLATLSPSDLDRAKVIYKQYRENPGQFNESSDSDSDVL